MFEPMGRPPVLDDRKRSLIIATISTGATRQVAAEYVGCHVETIRRTAARDPEFARRLCRAEAKSQLQPIGAIRKAARKGDWRAAAWSLERYFPNRYGKRDPEALTAEQVDHIVRQYAEAILWDLDDPQLRKKLQRRLAQLAGRISKQLPQATHGKRTTN